MTRIAELVDSKVNVSITVSLADLKEFLRDIEDEQYRRRKEIEARDKESELVSMYDVMAKFNVSKPTLWRWQKTGYLVPVKIGRRIFYHKEAIEKLIGKPL